MEGVAVGEAVIVEEVVTEEVPKPLALTEAVPDVVGEAVADRLPCAAAAPPQATPGG